MAILLSVIRQIKPSKLFIIADGPRPDRPDDLKKCEMTRALFEKIDWSCDVFKRYAEVNLGFTFHDVDDLVESLQDSQKLSIL